MSSLYVLDLILWWALGLVTDFSYFTCRFISYWWCPMPYRSFYIFAFFVKISRVHRFVALSSHLQFHSPTCLDFSQYHVYFITVVLQYSMKSWMVIPPWFLYCTGTFLVSWIFWFLNMKLRIVLIKSLEDCGEHLWERCWI